MQTANTRYSTSSVTGGSMMTTRFDDIEIKETDVILTTKAGEQVRILLSQLVNSANFKDANFDMSNSRYFNKHYDASMMKPFQVQNDAHVSLDDLANSIIEDLKENHFD